MYGRYHTLYIHGLSNFGFIFYFFKKKSRGTRVIPCVVYRFSICFRFFIQDEHKMKLLQFNLLLLITIYKFSTLGTDVTQFRGVIKIDFLRAVVENLIKFMLFWRIGVVVDAVIFIFVLYVLYVSLFIFRKTNKRTRFLSYTNTQKKTQVDNFL